MFVMTLLSHNMKLDRCYIHLYFLRDVMILRAGATHLEQHFPIFFLFVINLTAAQLWRKSRRMHGQWRKPWSDLMPMTLAICQGQATRTHALG